MDEKKQWFIKEVLKYIDSNRNLLQITSQMLLIDTAYSVYFVGNLENLGDETGNKMCLMLTIQWQRL